MPSQTFTASATTSASVHRIWLRLQVADIWAAVSGVDDVYQPVFDGQELVGFKFRSTAGGRVYEGVASPGLREAEKSLAWDIQTSEIKGTVTVELTPETEATRIHITMRVESVSMMAAFAFPMIAAAIAHGFQEAVDDFAASMTV